jgi:hypothetical protein
MRTGTATLGLVLGLLICTGCGEGASALSHASLPDTPENRALEARRYLAAVPPTDMFADMAESMAEVMPQKEAEELQEMMTKHIDLVAFETFLLESMARHFTAEELGALADFYSSPVGRSSMDKFDGYMADAMPFIQEQTILALQRAEEERTVEATGGR